jgi:hypothetical protein
MDRYIHHEPRPRDDRKRFGITQMVSELMTDTRDIIWMRRKMRHELGAKLLQQLVPHHWYKIMLKEQELNVRTTENPRPGYRKFEAVIEIEEAREYDIVVYYTKPNERAETKVENTMNGLARWAAEAILRRIK